MDITKLKQHDAEKANALHEWIDDEVPQIIDDEAEKSDPEIVIDKEQLKAIEKEIVKMLKQYFK